MINLFFNLLDLALNQFSGGSRRSRTRGATAATRTARG